MYSAPVAFGGKWFESETVRYCAQFGSVDIGWWYRTCAEAWIVYVSFSSTSGAIWIWLIYMCEFRFLLHHSRFAAMKEGEVLTNDFQVVLSRSPRDHASQLAKEVKLTRKRQREKNRHSKTLLRSKAYYPSLLLRESLKKPVWATPPTTMIIPFS
jgi:hypothetical protein